MNTGFGQLTGVTLTNGFGGKKEVARSEGRVNVVWGHVWTGREGRRKRRRDEEGDEGRNETSDEGGGFCLADFFLLKKKETQKPGDFFSPIGKSRNKSRN